MRRYDAQPSIALLANTTGELQLEDLERELLGRESDPARELVSVRGRPLERSEDRGARAACARRSLRNGRRFGQRLEPQTSQAQHAEHVLRLERDVSTVAQESIRAGARRRAPGTFRYAIV